MDPVSASSIEMRMESGKDGFKEDKSKNKEVSTETDRIRVKPRIGLFSGITFIVGSVIGSGIFISPVGALRNSGSVGMSLVVWTFCGGLSFLLAMIYAELAVLMPQSGGDYTYIRAAIGDIPAFLVAWIQTTIGHAGSRAVLALVFADYLCAPIFGKCGPPNGIRKTIATIELLSLAISNTISVRFAASMQGLFTFLKVTALIVISVGGLVYLFKGRTENFENSFEGTTSDVTSLSLAIYSCMWAYGGYNNLNEIAEELIEPKRNIPRALVISLTLITAIYILANVSYFTILTKAEFLSVSAVAFSWGDRVFGAAAIVIPISVMCSVYGASNGGMFTDVRVRFAASRAGHLPEVLSFLHHKSRIPVASLMFNTACAIILLIPADVNELIHIVSFVGFLINGLTVCSLLRMKYVRRKIPKVKGAFTNPIFVPIIALIICVFMLVSPFLNNPNIEFVYGAAFIVSGLLFYFPFVYFNLKSPGLDSVTTFVQLVLDVCPTVIDEGEDLVTDQTTK